MSSFSISGNLVDVHQKKIYPARVNVEQGLIQSVEPINQAQAAPGFIVPGFIDAHVHIESSMLVPSEFAQLAVVHGTVATVSDPHEIANVCGMQGVRFMIENGKTVPFKFHFGAPSCVPATNFETAGAILNATDVAMLLQNDDIYYLSEMMNFPGVLNEDPEVMMKIASAHHLLKPVDGHAPGLRGDEAKRYIAAGITTDHECFTREEALDKLQNGMKVIIREGSAAKNFEALIELLHEFPNQMMFCSDDKHPDSLVEGHINRLCARAVKKNIDLFKILQAACVNPVHHYDMRVGLLREHDPADFVVVKDLERFDVLATYVDGTLVASEGKSRITTTRSALINHFGCTKKRVEDFEVPWKGEKEISIIEALDGQLITNRILQSPKVEGGLIVPDLSQDMLKIVVVNRYQDAPVATAFIRRFGLRFGALASSVAHDSHNIVAVGTDDETICQAVNMVIENQGGVSFVGEDTQMIVPLPVAGLMSNEDGYRVAELYSLIDKTVKQAGCALSAPFMTLSFMALLVIPHLKLSDRGLFDCDRFRFVE